MEETGVVIKTEGLIAKVAVETSGACEGCEAGDACIATDKGAEIDAFNEIQARVGQTVRIEMRPYTYLKGTVLVYGLPLFLFIAASVTGKLYAQKYYLHLNTDMIAAICGFSFFTISFVIIKILSGRFEKKTGNKPVIQEIIIS